MKIKTTFYIWLLLVEQCHNLRIKAVLKSGGRAADTSVSLVRLQQDEQTVAGMDTDS